MRSAPPRSESLAYPPANTKSMLSRVQYYCRQHSKSVVSAVVLAILVTVLLISDSVKSVLVASSSTTSSSFLKGSAAAKAALTFWGGAVRPGYFVPNDAIVVSSGSQVEFRFAAVTDLDELSRVKDSSKPEFYSIFLSGTLKLIENNRYQIQLDTTTTRTLVTKHNEAGRGAEFSELVIYQNRLLTFDDRTGSVFEILNNEQGTDSLVVPRFVITEGRGETDKGMKWEWSTVKNNELYMGSMGKEYTLPDGTVKNRNNLWVVVLNERGEMRREDWSDKYGVVRTALGAQFPGYMIIEACNWSPFLKKWVFLPRRISSQAYDEVQDEKMGGDKLVLVDESFSHTQVVQLKDLDLDPLKGFSTFAFVPNTQDRIALAIRSVEENCVDFTPKCQQRSYFVVFDVLSGQVLSEEVEYEDKVKFEGVEFVDMYTVPPP